MCWLRFGAFGSDCVNGVVTPRTKDIFSPATGGAAGLFAYREKNFI
jgi:hypothetical protein